MNRLGVIAALPAEASCFFAGKTPLKTIIQVKAEKTLLYVCGMGANNAQAAAQKLIDAGATHLVSWGTAGSLSEVAQPGDLLLPEFIQSEDGQTLQTGHHWRQRITQQLPTELKIHQGSLFQSSEVIASPTHKSQVYSATNAIAVDMESYAIATVANKNKIPFLVIRSIVDGNEESIPTSAIHSVDEFGCTKPLTLARNLAQKPADLPKLIRLGNRFKKARQTLMQVTASTGTPLAFDKVK